MIATTETANKPFNFDTEISLLQESNDKANAILTNCKEIILTINLEKNEIAYVNDAISILGYKPDDWIGKAYKTWPELKRQKFHELMKLAVQSQLQVNNQRISFPDKWETTQIPFEFSTSIFFLKKQRYLLCVLRDLRERVQYEERKSNVANQLNRLINNIEDVYAVFDLKTLKYDFISENVEEMFGSDKHFFCRTNSLFWKTCIHPDDLYRVENEVNIIVNQTSKGKIFYRITTAQGERKKIAEKLVVGKDKQGRPEKLFIIKTDCTSMEDAEQSLIETERKFRFISENLSDFISIHDTDWNFTYASPSIINILGFTPAEVLGKGSVDLVHPDDLLKTIHECIQPIVLQKIETHIRYRMLSKNGNYKWVETYAKPVIDSRNEISSIICSTRDVTDQVNAEVKLRESEEQYRLISENSNDLIGIHNLRKEFLYVSPSCRQILGYEPGELIGKRPEDIFVKSDKANLRLLNQANEVIATKKESRYLSTVYTKTGEEKLLEVWLKPVLKNGELVGLQSASRDVTEREKLLGELKHSLEKERELNELREKFVATASHQFRTPLTVIQSGIELMHMYLDEVPEEKQAKFENQFSRIQEEVSRLEYLMNDVLLLGRANAARTPFHPQRKCLINFCTHIINNKYNNRYPSNRQVLLTTKGKEVPVNFDEKLLGHAIENIINNAYKYSFKGNIQFHILFDKKKVSIHITDLGLGIPEEDIKNLFQPFYRATNTIDIKGTGLGLSIVKEFVEKHGGEIFLSSKLNKGTTVSVILPIE